MSTFDFYYPSYNMKRYSNEFNIPIWTPLPIWSDKEKQDYSQILIEEKDIDKISEYRLVFEKIVIKVKVDRSKCKIVEYNGKRYVDLFSNYIPYIPTKSANYTKIEIVFVLKEVTVTDEICSIKGKCDFNCEKCNLKKNEPVLKKSYYGITPTIYCVPSQVSVPVEFDILTWNGNFEHIPARVLLSKGFAYVVVSI